MRRRHKLGGAVLLASWFLLLVCAGSGVAAQQHDPLIGIWRSVGYAELLVIKEDQFLIYSETASSLMPRQRGKRKGNLLSFEGEPESALIVLEDGLLHLWRNEFTLGRSYRRATEKEVRPTSLIDDPLVNLRIAWEAFDENYAFFELRRVDWGAQYERARTRLKPDSTQAELFLVLSEMLAALGDDGHAWLRAPDGRRFSGASVNPHPMRALRPQWLQLIGRQYLKGKGAEFANGRLFTSKLPDGTLYLGLRGVEGFAADRDAAKNISSFNQALDKILGNLRPGDPLVLDLRLNPGGYDDYSLLIAGRLTDRPKVAFLKQPRIQRTQQFGPLHVRHVFPSAGPRATGPVMLLTGGLTYSGAEILVLATMQLPNVVRIGEATAGALSDVLAFKLPNGWEIGLSNERYFAADGVCYEERGIPPHVAAPMTRNLLEKNIDPGLEAAMRLIVDARRNKLRTE